MLYRRLAAAYPHEFRMLYGDDLDRDAEEAIPEIWRRFGAFGLMRLLTDIAIQLPAQYLHEVRRDVQYALRMLARSPGFTAAAVLSLAIGIGMCCTVLSESESLAGSPPGVLDPGALVTIRSDVSYPYFEHVRDQPQGWTAATAVIGPVPLAVAFSPDKSAKAERFYGRLVSPEFFGTLGAGAAAGRYFTPETAKPGTPPVVVISDRFWRMHMGSDPQAVGRTLRLNGTQATIVAIGPKEFLGLWPVNPTDLFVPVTCATSLAPELSGDPLHRPDQAMFRVVLRLAPGVIPARAEAALDAMARSLDRENGFDRDRDSKGTLMRLIPAGTRMFMTPEQHGYLTVFNGMLWALTLSLVCANLASLLLARAHDRRREIAVRLSVGASRPRLVRQILTESVLLSLAGAAGGVVLAYWFTHAISKLNAPSPIPVQYNCEPDLRVLALTLALGFAAGVGFGLTPALSASRVDIGRTLKEGAQAPMRGYRRFGLRNLFVVGQMAASLMLLVVTCYIVIGFRSTTRLDPGVVVADLNVISLDPVRDGYTADRTAALYAGLPDELSRTGEIRDASFTTSVPFASSAAESPNAKVSAQATGGAPAVLVPVFRDRIGAHYFATLGVPLVGGRDFDRRDRERDGTAILNQTAARALFGRLDPIGRLVRDGTVFYTVVGITRDVPSGFLVSRHLATMYLPLTADWFRSHPAQRITILARGGGGRDGVAAIRRQFASLHPDLTVFNAHTVQEDLDRLNAWADWNSAIYLALGMFALLLACLGLGGVTAYAVVQRRKEIGIRMALGARPRQVQGLVLREGVVLVTVGSVLGFGGAAALARILSSFTEALARTFGNRIDDPVAVIGLLLALAGLAMLACYLPARRATRVNPVTALREE
jgi:predicted permease